MLLEQLLQVHETVLHSAVHRWMLDPSRVHTTCRGHRVQILSPGMLNTCEGPDFLNAALMIESTVISGSIEFDKYRSYWDSHHHSSADAYQSVILHVVLVNDVERKHYPDALLVPANELTFEVSKSEQSPLSQEEVQSYALLRLLRLCTEHTQYFQSKSIVEGFQCSVRDFLRRYSAKHRRPHYTQQHLDELVARAVHSPHASFLMHLVQRKVPTIPQHLTTLSQVPLADEATHIRMEIMTNCVVPSACVVASDSDRVSIFTWYWSARANTKYSILSRRFPQMSQQYIWQQQGLLEMLRYRQLPATLSEAFRMYGALLTLDFYHSALESPQLDDER